MKQSKVVKVTVQLGDVEVSLTVDEARDLHRVLSDLLGKPVTYTTPWYPSYPYIHWKVDTKPDVISDISYTISTTDTSRWTA